MTTINLKDFYPWYTHDEYIEVSDEVAAARYCPDSCANSSRRLPAVGMVTRPAATRPDTASIPTRCRPRT